MACSRVDADFQGGRRFESSCIKAEDGDAEEKERSKESKSYISLDWRVKMDCMHCSNIQNMMGVSEPDAVIMKMRGV